MNHIFFSLYHDTLADVILTYKTYLRIVADQNHPFHDKSTFWRPIKAG